MIFCIGVSMEGMSAKKSSNFAFSVCPFPLKTKNQKLI